MPALYILKGDFHLQTTPGVTGILQQEYLIDQFLSTCLMYFTSFFNIFQKAFRQCRDCVGTCSIRAIGEFFFLKSIKMGNKNATCVKAALHSWGNKKDSEQLTTKLTI